MKTLGWKQTFLSLPSIPTASFWRAPPNLPTSIINPSVCVQPAALHDAFVGQLSSKTCNTGRKWDYDWLHVWCTVTVVLFELFCLITPELRAKRCGLISDSLSYRVPLPIFHSVCTKEKVADSELGSSFDIKEPTRPVLTCPFMFLTRAKCVTLWSVVFIWYWRGGSQ